MGEKFILKSKTIWGVIIMALPTLFEAFGVPVPDGVSEQVNDAVVHLIEFVGASLAVYGRISAEQPVRVKP